MFSAHMSMQALAVQMHCAHPSTACKDLQRRLRACYCMLLHAHC